MIKTMNDNLFEIDIYKMFNCFDNNFSGQINFLEFEEVLNKIDLEKDKPYEYLLLGLDN